MRRTVIGVMGGGEAASVEAVAWADQIGAAIAREGWVLLSGGRAAGVMGAVSRGAKREGGLVIGVLPWADPDDASEAVDVAIVTAMGSARNNINVLSSDVVIACGEAEAGTMSEIALAVKAKRHVVLLNSDEDTCRVLERMGHGLVHPVGTPDSAIATTKALLQAAGR